MKKWIVLSLVTTGLLLVGCGEKKIESEADLKACQKEWGNKLKIHCNLFGGGDSKCADLKDEFLKSECGKATIVEKELKSKKHKEAIEKYKPDLTQHNEHIGDTKLKSF